MHFKIILNISYNKFIWPIDETLICIMPMDQSGPGSNGNEVETLHFQKNSRT